MARELTPALKVAAAVLQERAHHLERARLLADVLERVARQRARERPPGRPGPDRHQLDVVLQLCTWARSNRADLGLPLARELYACFGPTFEAAYVREAQRVTLEQRAAELAAAEDGC